MKVSVRMYCHGLGDCFLVRFDDFKIVIDCGIAQSADDGAEMVAEVVRHLRAETNSEIDVLVVTHEHRDHMSGFFHKAPAAEWEKFDRIGKLWLAWTEDPIDDFANSLRQTRRKSANLVANAAAAIKNNSALGATLNNFASLAFSGDEKASWMTLVQDLAKRKGAEIKCFKPGTVTELPGSIEAIVLGPPHDDLIKKSDPSTKNPETFPMPPTDDRAFALGFSLGVTPEALEQTGKFLGVSTHAIPSAASTTEEEYLRRLRDHMGLDNADAAGQIPFSASYRIPYEDVTFGSQPLGRASRLTEDEVAVMQVYGDPAGNWRRIDDEWLSVAQTLGLKLDSDTNNTSLALMFRLPNGRCLLFPGDAQVGNWLSWWNQGYTVKFSGSDRVVTIKQLLEQVQFYKVGHHGSHNATLQAQGLELMPDDLTAMIPVVHQQAIDANWGNNIPLPSIVERLKEKCGDGKRLARIDEADRADTSVFDVPVDRNGAGRPMFVEWTIDV
jgi:hypothetical protein